MDDLVKRLRAGTGGGKPWMDLHEEAADRIEALEAQVRAADALADALSFYASATVEYPSGNVTFQPGDDNGQRAKVALAAYREGSDT